MSEEQDFKAVRITLSQEAFDRMEKIMNQAKFRSYSLMIEECIRTIHDVMTEIYLIAGPADDPSPREAPYEDWVNTLGRIIIRMNRLTGKTILPSSYKPLRK